MDSRTLAHIKHVYRGTVRDYFERILRRVREKVLGFDYSIFDKPIEYYDEVKGQKFTYEEALARAINKKAHKDAWFVRERTSSNEIMGFYQEVDTYPFLNPYYFRFRGFRWYIHLVSHFESPSILEYGCGSAVLTEWLIERFPHCKYTVADIPSVTLDIVRWKKDRKGYAYNILEIGRGKEGIPLSDNYDLIICEDVLEHTPNPLDIVSSFIDNLSQDGVLVVNFVNSPGGENLRCAVEQRETVKALLKDKLIALKAIDEPRGNNGLYVKDDARKKLKNSP